MRAGRDVKPACSGGSQYTTLSTRRTEGWHKHTTPNNGRNGLTILRLDPACLQPLLDSQAAWHGLPGTSSNAQSSIQAAYWPPGINQASAHRSTYPDHLCSNKVQPCRRCPSRTRRLEGRVLGAAMEVPAQHMGASIGAAGRVARQWGSLSVCLAGAAEAPARWRKRRWEPKRLPACCSCRCDSAHGARHRRCGRHKRPAKRCMHQLDLSKKHPS